MYQSIFLVPLWQTTRSRSTDQSPWRSFYLGRSSSSLTTVVDQLNDKLKEKVSTGMLNFDNDSVAQT